MRELLLPDSQPHSGGLVRELLLPDSQRHSGGSGAGAALARLGSAIPDLVQDLLHVPQRGGA